MAVIRFDRQGDLESKEAREELRLVYKAVVHDFDLPPEKLQSCVDLCMRCIENGAERTSVRLMAVKIILHMKEQNDRNAHKVENRKIERIKAQQGLVKLLHESADGAKLLQEMARLISQPKDEGPAPPPTDPS